MKTRSNRRKQYIAVLQVYIRIRDEEWNVYRRYSQFHELHVASKRTDPVVASFHFPPKKTVGHRSADGTRILS